MAKVKNYNLNVTEVLDPTLKKKFSRNFQFHGLDLNEDFLDCNMEQFDNFNNKISPK